MKVGIHQLHYFPWLGYMNKMAASDSFIILDDVQLSDSSFMFRHKMLCKNGSEKYITLPFAKKDYMQKKYRELELNPEIEWQRNHTNFIRDNYYKAPFFDEVWQKISPVFNKEYKFLFEVTNDSMLIMRELLDVHTPLIYQSSLPTGIGKKSVLVLELCKAAGANTYLSGNGAQRYMDLELFTNNKILVKYQNFKPVPYKQPNSEIFVPGLCGLDMLFSVGIEESRTMLQKTLCEKEDRC